MNKRRLGDIYIYYIQCVPGGKVNILGGHSVTILSKNLYVYICPIPNGSRDRAISLYSFKLLIRKRFYVLFLIPVFIVQVTMSVQFT
jgi:hypothetical protein